MLALSTQTATIIRPTPAVPTAPLTDLGLLACRTIFLQLAPERLIQHALDRGEGVLTDTGALMCDTGQFTGRSPKDKFIVRDALTTNRVNWGAINQPFDVADFDRLHQKMLTFLEGQSVFVRYGRAGAHPAYRLNVAVVTTCAWHNLFAHNLFIRPAEAELLGFSPDWTVLCIPGFEANPVLDHTRQGNFTIVDFTRKIILIGGTGYAGEIKKGIFTVLNFLLPVQHGVLPMHCSANVGPAEAGGKPETALFFGLSGTGKTTLSADAGRQLIGDDEHGWVGGKTDPARQIFNFEGGCYAKVINLTAESEPEIFGTIRPGALLENTRFVPGTNTVDFADQSVTENTRVGYPLNFINGAIQPSLGATPKHVFFLTADAFGVLPPISRLTTEQAMTQFLLGYTAKLAGTEMGIVEPVATFSACFGAAFLPLAPREYADLLGERIRESGATVWLVNTGWTGGAFGTGSRIKLPYTRALVRAAIRGDLDSIPYQTHPIFGLAIPTDCPDVPAEVLDPVKTWPTAVAYSEQAQKLVALFQEQIKKF